VIALSIGFYGFKGGLWIAIGNTGRIWGPPGSFIADNNGLGLALNMVLPLLFFLARDEPNKKLRRLLQATFFLSILSILFTYSRGAFLGISVVMAYLFFSVQVRTKIAMICLVLVGVPVVLTILPDTWFSRMGTFQSIDEDVSAMSRVDAWHTAYNLALDHPLTGGGFQIIDDSEIYPRYSPSGSDAQGVHSIYFEVIGENGFITFAVFVALMVSSILSMRGLRRRLRGRDPDGLSNYSHALEISVAAFAVSGAFLEKAGFDLFYHVLALVIVLRALASEAVLEQARPPVPRPRKTIDRGEPLRGIGSTPVSRRSSPGSPAPPA
jgi:probable O-glycosylation ligase (exosortase A-associated)